MEPVSGDNCPNCKLLAAEMAVLKARFAELEARLGKDSTNSSKPPSTDPPWDKKSPQKEQSGRKPGGQPGHKGSCREQSKTPDRTIKYYAGQCENCHAVLNAGADDAGIEPKRRHQVAELRDCPVEIAEHRECGLKCSCGHVTYGEIPQAVLKRNFGPKLTAAISVLVGQGHVSRRAAQCLLETVFNTDISLGAVAGLEREMSAALESHHAEALAAVRGADVRNSDETGWSSKGDLCRVWLAVAQIELAAAFVINGSRGKAGRIELLGEKPRGVTGCDRWHAYNGLLRQICWAHLIRDFQKLIDFNPKHSSGNRLGLAGKWVARRLFDEWHKFKAGELTPTQLAEKLQHPRKVLRRALDLAQKHGDKKTARFAKKLMKCEPELWTFLTVANVEPTNNLAERHLRPGVLWRKISLGSWGDDGCRFAERMMTVVQTLKMRGKNVMAFLCDAVTALRHGTPTPSLLT